MIVIETAALLGMLWMIARAFRLGLRARRDPRPKQFVLPVLTNLCVAALLFFAAFGGASDLLPHWGEVVRIAIGFGIVFGIVSLYFRLLARARARQRRERDE